MIVDWGGNTIDFCLPKPQSLYTSMLEMLGRCYPLSRAKVFDATGKELTDKIDRCNTETGEISVLVTDDDGRIQMNADKTAILRRQITAPAPLRIEWQAQ